MGKSKFGVAPNVSDAMGGSILPLMREIPLQPTLPPLLLLKVGNIQRNWMTREYFSRLLYSFPVNVPWEVSGESWQMQIVSDRHSSCCWAAIDEAGVKNYQLGWVLFLVCLSPEQLLIWIVMLSLGKLLLRSKISVSPLEMRGTTEYIK